MENTDRLIDILENAQSRLAGAERDTYLADVCRDDAELKRQVLSLLHSHESAGTFLTNPLLPSLNASSNLREKAGDVIGRYRLLEKLGEGGCGVIYSAEQTEPVRRRVALKVIKLGMDTMQVIARFEAERQALAMMDHPNIARVLDAGSSETGRPFFVMELVRGVRITEFCEEHLLSARERLDLFIQVCHAVQHAHQKGIIHRDIKPSNILVTFHDGVPVPKVIDFGIAKAIQGRLTDSTVQTQSLPFVGTPAYMSPEQADTSLHGAGDVDTRTDIYSLGVLLYELLTGQLPFDGHAMLSSGLDAMRRTIRETEPVRPSALQRHPAGAIHTDLDWIVMKCLEKDRSRRYHTANALAADLTRFLNNEPVTARPPTASYRFQKAFRRNKLAFIAAAGVSAALVVGLLVASWQAVRASRSEKAARENVYAAEMNLGFQALAENNLAEALKMLDRQRPLPGNKDLRGFEWRYLWQRCQGDQFAIFRDEGTMGAAAYSPDGKTLVYGGSKMIIRDAVSLTLITTISQPASSLSFAPHTNLLAAAHTAGVDLWSTASWQKVRTLTNAILPALFSPDGRWLLTGAAGGFLLWDTKKWSSVSFDHSAPDLMWQARTSVAFSPDGQFLLTISGHNLDVGDHLRLWRLPGLEELPPMFFDTTRGGEPGAVTFTTDGKHLIVGLWNGDLDIFEFGTRKLVKILRKHRAWVSSVAVAKEGNIFATGSSDQTINLWNADTFEFEGSLHGNIGRVWSLAISADGGTVLAGNPEGTARLWHTSLPEQNLVLKRTALLAGFSRNHGDLVLGGTNAWYIWAPGSVAPEEISIPSTASLLHWGKPYSVSEDGLAALGRANGMVELWNLRTKSKLREWQAHDNGICVVSFSPGGKMLATAATNGTVTIWSLNNLEREPRRFSRVACYFLTLEFSPDGKTLAGSGKSSSVWLWDVKTGKEMRQISNSSTVGTVTFSPDGTLLAVPCFDGKVRLWEWPLLNELPPLTGHAQSIVAAAFSHDNRTLATADMSWRIKLWNIPTGNELTTIPGSGRLPMLAFSPDDRMLVASERPQSKGTIQVLQAPSFDEISRTEAAHVR